MDLILSVVADPQGANMLKHTKLFTSAGGSFGRSDGNDWVLPDPDRVVSSKHALISFEKNQYLLVDNSTNGTYHNHGKEPLGKGNRITLNDGDIISVGEYQIKVTLRVPQSENGLPKGLGEAEFLDSSDRTAFTPASAAKMQSQAEAQQLDSWLDSSASPAGSHSGEWGAIVAGASSAVPADNLLSSGPESLDPLAALSNTANSGHDFSVAPAGEFGFGSDPAAGSSVSQWGDDDWWKDSSEPDHAPADQHAMQFRAQQPSAPISESPSPVVSAAPAPLFQQPPPSPSPSQFSQPQPQPQPQFPLQPQQADNPFAGSQAVMQGQQVNGVPGFGGDLGGTVATPFTEGAPNASRAREGGTEEGWGDMRTAHSADNFSSASQQFSPQIQGAAPVAEMPVATAPVNAASPVPATAPQRAPAAAHTLAQQLGLNLTPQQSQQLEAQAAGIVQETVARLIDLLRARSSIKNELRVQRTMIQVEANNPLKFSATAGDALAAMFTSAGAFMSPQHAVKDSFNDLSDHQVAVLAGMRAGYDAMLKYFNPEKIERRLNSQGGLLSSKSAKNWDGFEAMYRELVRDPDACYRRLFGDEFAAIYEQQLSELKNARHLNQ